MPFLFLGALAFLAYNQTQQTIAAPSTGIFDSVVNWFENLFSPAPAVQSATAASPSFFDTINSEVQQYIETPFFSVFGATGINTVSGDIAQQALGIAKQTLQAREGYRNDVYYDDRGIPTVGIGHRVTSADGLSVGDTISDQQVDLFFTNDTSKALSAALSQAQTLNKNNVNLVAALISVNFQLGTGWTTTFANTWKALQTGNWQDAINRLNQSSWAQQTPVRVADFTSAIQNAYA